MRFAEILGTLRKVSGHTQQSLAERAGVSFRTLQSWEQGHRSPVSPDFFRLVRALGVSADAFAACVDEVKPAKGKRGKKR
jgi:transcriptional regulator with XRE-family HTH domain